MTGQEGNTYKLQVELANGTVLDAGNITAPPGPQGERGEKGEKGDPIDLFSVALPEPTPGVIYLSSGNSWNQANAVSYEHIRLIDGATVNIRGAIVSYSLSICAYREDGTFVRCLGNDMGSTSIDLDVVVDGFDYINISTLNTATVEVRYTSDIHRILDPTALTVHKKDSQTMEYAKYLDTVGNYLRLDVSADAFAAGYIGANGIDIVASSWFMHSPYIPVMPFARIHLSGAIAGYGRVALFYDQNKKFVSGYSSTNANTAEDYEMEVPYNGYFVRYHTVTSALAKTSIAYAEPVQRGHREAAALTKFENMLGRSTDSFLKSAAAFPIVTVIDDAASTAAQVERFYNLCRSAGIRGTYAPITAHVMKSTDMRDKLLDYEKEGFQIIFLCHDQVKAYNYSDNRDLAAAEADFVQGLREMQELGFRNYDYWATPYAVKDEDMQSLARRHGMKCLLNVENDYNSLQDTNRYNINRHSIKAVDTANTTFEGLKAVAADCIANNGWLVLCSHVYEDGWDKSTRLGEFVSYVNECSGGRAKFMTLAEGFSIRKAIYDAADMF